MLHQTGANCSSDSYANDAKHIVQTLHNIVMSEITYIVSPSYWIMHIQNSRLISESCSLAAFLSGSLLHIYEKQITWRYNGDKQVYDDDFAEFCLWKVNVDSILCLGLTAQKF